jgi:adenosylcobyric acid synthase
VGALLVTGTSSDVGKSVLVAGLCRWLARQEVRVAPFKAQNMSLNSFVTRAGEEIGRAQAAQAQACGIEPEAVMNPVLLKPGSDTSSQLIVMGHAVAEYQAARYWLDLQRGLLDVVVEAFRGLMARFDVVVCEGAGSPAEINLRQSDIVNLGFARAAGGVPTVLVGDIDRGGVFASLIGTLAVLDPADQALVAGFVINKFRGDLALLRPGLAMLERRTGRPVLGVLPFAHDIGVDAEDSIDRALLLSGGPPLGEDVLRVNVVAFPRISNHTDLDALAVEPGVVVRFVTDAAALRDADLIVLPGTRATVADLGWLRERGLDQAVHRHIAAGRPVLGICGGYQMLGTVIEDRVESRMGTVAGLGLLPVRTEFAPAKTLGRPSRALADGTIVHGYEIHHGTVVRHGGQPLIADEGCRDGPVAGTVWHGLLENDSFRRDYLAGVARAAGRQFAVVPDTCFAGLREARLDRLADLVAANLDHGVISRLLDGNLADAPSLRLSLGAGVTGYAEGERNVGDCPGRKMPGTCRVGSRKREVRMEPEEARERLLAEQAEIGRSLGQVEEAARQDREAETAGGPHDRADEAQPLAAEYEDDAIAETLRDRLEQVGRALQRIGEGTWGRSVRSGVPIPAERLEADPAAELTVEEASGQERAFGG